MKETIESNKENTTTQDTLIKTLGAFPTFDLNSIVQNDQKNEKLEIPSATETNRMQNEEIVESMSDISESVKEDGNEEIGSETKLENFKPNNESKKKYFKALIIINFYRTERKSKDVQNFGISTQIH